LEVGLAETGDYQQGARFIVTSKEGIDQSP